MRLFIVASPESYFTAGLLLAVSPRKITQNEICNNITALEQVRIFESFNNACDYARSLRICRASHVPLHPEKKSHLLYM